MRKARLFVARSAILGLAVMNAVAANAEAPAATLKIWILNPATIGSGGLAGEDLDAPLSSAGTVPTRKASAATVSQDDADQDDAAQDDPRPMRTVQRLSNKVPSGLAMGTPFRLRVRFPRSMVNGVEARQFDASGNAEFQDDVPLEATPDGQTYAVVTPLLNGKLKFIINAVFKDHAASVEVFTASVATPSSRPTKFWADSFLSQGPARDMIGVFLNHDGILRPEILFASAPDNPVTLRGGTTFRVLPSNDEPVIEMRPDGSFKSLRLGRAQVEVGFGGFTTQVFVEVIPP